MTEQQKRKKPGALRKVLVEWLGGTFTPATANDWITYWGGSSSSAGQTVNDTNVLKLSAAWACTRLIAETVGTLPLKVYKKTDNGREEATNHPLYSILHNQPNATTTPSTLFESLVAACLLRGNAFCERKTIGGRLVALDFLDPARSSITKWADGRIRFQYKELNGRTREINPAALFHVPGFSTDGQFGMSAIQFGSKVFGNAIAADTAAANTFDKGLMPTVAFTLDRVVQEEQRAQFREYLDDVTGALHAGESPLLEEGMDAKTIGIPPKDAQLLESRTFSVEEVCRWFRVDPSLVGHGGKDSNFGTGLEQKMLGFLMFTLRIWLKRIEDSVALQLLTPQDRLNYYAEYSIEGLLRADSKTRAEFWQIMVDHGLFTRDEVRLKENMRPMGGNAGVLTVNAATTPLDQLAVQTTRSEQQMAAFRKLEAKVDSLSEGVTNG